MTVSRACKCIEYVLRFAAPGHTPGDARMQLTRPTFRIWAEFRPRPRTHVAVLPIDICQLDIPSNLPEPFFLSSLPFYPLLFYPFLFFYLSFLFSSTYAEGLRIVLVSRVSILPLCVCPRRATRFPEEKKKNERIGKTTEWKRTEGWVTSEPQKSSAVADRKFKAENRCSPPSCCPFVELVNVYGSCPGDIFPFNVTSPVSPALQCSILLINLMFDFMSLFFSFFFFLFADFILWRRRIVGNGVLGRWKLRSRSPQKCFGKTWIGSLYRELVNLLGVDWLRINTARGWNFLLENERRNCRSLLANRWFGYLYFIAEFLPAGRWALWILQSKTKHSCLWSIAQW